MGYDWYEVEYKTIPETERDYDFSEWLYDNFSCDNGDRISLSSFDFEKAIREEKKVFKEKFKSVISSWRAYFKRKIKEGTDKEDYFDFKEL